MNSNSNKFSFNPATRKHSGILLANGLATSKPELVAGVAGSKIIFDILFRNFDTANPRLLNIWIGPNNNDLYNNKVQVSIPANAGNNGSVPLASLRALAPQLFEFDLAGNQFINLEDANEKIWVENTATLTANLTVSFREATFILP